eukprot:TRINITY_DN62447_c0_g1_i1.p1 TRINITY_DN62447_c0_g1~~TRINITY_DN62447_c0_g1_i1.p1  ORF type:complete len:102 (+),score=14.58 TRINITY_DN62447_c0_g1_i1:192-497(+)
MCIRDRCVCGVYVLFLLFSFWICVRRDAETFVCCGWWKDVGIALCVMKSVCLPVVGDAGRLGAVSYTHLRAHETPEHLVCRLLLEKKKNMCNEWVGRFRIL